MISKFSVCSYRFRREYRLEQYCSAGFHTKTVIPDNFEVINELDINNCDLLHVAFQLATYYTENILLEPMR